MSTEVPHLEIKALQQQIYAGVLGKIIGVYLGRPVEGWSYAAIKERFDEIYYYAHRSVGVPLIVADDDISGTFGSLHRTYGLS
jgi:ADP-ribosylglycohydrolase